MWQAYLLILPFILFLPSINSFIVSRSIAFLVPYPVGEAPSQRFRFEQYFTLLKENHFHLDVFPFLSPAAWHILYQRGKFLRKLIAIMSGFVRRIGLLFLLYRYDLVFIHREASPIGPPVFEWFIAKVLCKKIIFDFDDAIWLPNTSSHNRIAAHLKWHSKTASICNWAYKVSCGNEFLCQYAARFNNRVILNPTTIDTEKLHCRIKDQHTGKVAIGWTGTHSTLPYLYPLLPVLTALEKEYDFDFIVISNRQPDFHLQSLLFIPWRKETEIDDLLRLHIGVMPLPDDEWAKGKCGFKALQYMALGIPAVVSPVGVNRKIVDPGVNGFFADDPQEWRNALLALLTDADRRAAMGKQARKKIEQCFSVQSNKTNFLSLFAD